MKIQKPLLRFVLNVAVFVGLAYFSIVLTTTDDRAFQKQLMILAVALLATAVAYHLRRRYVTPLPALLAYDIVTLSLTILQLFGIGSSD